MSRKRTASSSSDLTSKRVLTDKSIVTVAIDFGTAGTGYGYSFLGSDVIEAKEPGGQEARKTLTNLLLARDGSFKSFGFEARREYAESQRKQCTIKHECGWTLTTTLHRDRGRVLPELQDGSPAWFQRIRPGQGPRRLLVEPTGSRQ